MDDKALYEGASFDQIREYFRSWISGHEEHMGERAELCLVVDEESLNSIMAHPVTPEDSYEDPTGWVWAVDPGYTPPGGGYDNLHYEG